MKNFVNFFRNKEAKSLALIYLLFSILFLTHVQQADAQVTLSMQLSEQNGLTSVGSPNIRP